MHININNIDNLIAMIIVDNGDNYEYVDDYDGS